MFLVLTMCIPYGRKVKKSYRRCAELMDELQDIWIGRVDSETDQSQFRYHQVVRFHEQGENDIGLIGFSSDEGVRRNNGRLGAKEGPNAIRQQLASFPWHFSGGLFDYGNIYCENHALESTQIKLGKAVSQVLNNNHKLIVLGGGHETTYGHYLGVREAIGSEKKLGIINIDAHFDMRPYDIEPTSGTMFKQILDDDPNASYFVMGIQQFGNTVSLFEEAKQKNVQYILEEHLNQTSMEDLTIKLQQFIDRHDAVYLTLCMDVLNVSYAPGVSATNAFGLDPFKVREIIRTVLACDKTTSFDICEVNPAYDIDNRTAKLAAAFVNEAIHMFTTR